MNRALRFLQRLRRDARGNIMMLAGFSIIPLTTAVGVGVDYARAARAQTKLNAAADAAALAAVSQSEMPKTDQDAQQLAQYMFMQQASTISDLNIQPANVTVTISHSTQLANDRQATVSYTASVNNAFGAFIGQTTTGLQGSSQASASRAPNIDFYLLLDTSPSMLLPATTAGLQQLTANANGCAFACHMSNLSSGDTTTFNGRTADYYTVARGLNITLRTDLMVEGVQNLVQVADQTGSQNNAVYRMALAQFDYRYQNVVAQPTNPDSLVGQIPSLQTPIYCVNNSRVCGVNDNDTTTNTTAAFAGAIATLPQSPGNGTNNPGDTPQAVLFLVTDGMRDEAVGGNPGNRQMGPFPVATCNQIKATGTRIAVLYTEYLPATATIPWAVTNVLQPFLQPNDLISPALQQCASPGLYYKVSTDGDISAALAALFNQAVATAHLVR